MGRAGLHPARAGRPPGRRNSLTGWLDASELRIGLGCMRLAEEQAFETVAAAAAAGITVFDTARAYAGNEPLVAQALRRCGAEDRARIVTKGGMAAGWVPDGRAKTIRADCEGSLVALDGVPIDVYLVHAPDPRTPWRTTVRALARLVDDGLVRRVGLSNVNRPQLDEALDLAPVAAVEVALSPFDDHALRGGIVERCEELGISVIAHSPLGGPRRAHRISAEAALAWLLELSPVVVPIPGARRPETVRSAARAATLELDDGQRSAFGAPRPARRAAAEAGEIVVVMGVPGAGKSRVAAAYAERGFLRLNRDERSGTLRALAAALDEELAAGARRIVLDNTYLTRASRSYVLDAAARHGLRARCIWVDVPLAQAQVNLVERLLDRFGRLPTPEELRSAAREPGMLTPTSQMRTFRDLEPPAPDEGFTEIERRPFVRESRARARTAVFVAAGAVELAVGAGDAAAPHLVYHWDPDGAGDALDAAVVRLSTAVSGPVEGALCPHAAGPPRCWCRPPLPGLPLAFARAHDVDVAGSLVVGTGAAHRTLANALGALYVGPAA
ncbi:MAG: aldo/keto reductase [Gaiellaceae bacterium]